jgi:hypothetical protein
MHPHRSSLGDSGAIGVPFSGETRPPLSAFKPNFFLCYDRQLIIDLFFMAALEVVVVPGDYALCRCREFSLLVWA